MDNDDQHNRKRRSKIKKDVEDRIKEEAINYPAPLDTKGEIKSSFIRWCIKHGNQLGDGLFYTTIHRDKFVFNKASKAWLLFNGQHWELDQLDASFAGVEDCVEVLIEENGRIADEITWNVKKGDTKKVEALQRLQIALVKNIKRLRSTFGITNCLRHAHSNREPLAIRGDELDLHPLLLPCKNSVIDLRSGKSRDGRPDEYLFKASPTEWKGFDESAERWVQFLHEIMNGNEDLVNYLQRLLGYAITGLSIEHIFPVFFGVGRNGKGKLVEALTYTLGPLAGSIQSELLLDQKRPRSSQGPSPDIMTLNGLRLAFASETDEGQRFSAAKVKWLTGGDQLIGRHPNDKYEVRFMPTHTLFLLTNDKPASNPYDFGFWQRMHLIPFHLSFVMREPKQPNERRADKYLGEKLKKEASGILAWLVKGCLDYQKEGLKPPLDVIEQTAEYRRSQDLLADWVDDYCVLGPDEKGQASELYDHFVKWYRVNVSRKHDFSQTKFGNQMRRAKFEKSKSMGVVYYTGIDLDPAAPYIDDTKNG